MILFYYYMIHQVSCFYSFILYLISFSFIIVVQVCTKLSTGFSSADLAQHRSFKCALSQTSLNLALLEARGAAFSPPMAF